ncbi:PucR family transcriptional regulator [Galactobacter valiniphilus]|uniref:PucR family transcriptional regulator n=1 Tax=Galactobacter valiniphilus TaxID=2676122 RepID=UPI003736E963
MILPVITLEQLISASAGALRLAPGQGAGHGPAAAPITGVHVSELEDPTPYLEGGELLLTTGMPWGRGGAQAYVAGLASRGVAALGVGLGPWARAVPEAVTEACREHGLALAVVPDGVPFQNVSRAYWRLALRDDTAGLRQAMGVQAQLVRSATRPHAVTELVRSVAQALGGWAAYLPSSPLDGAGSPPSAGAGASGAGASGAGASGAEAGATLWPPTAAPSLRVLRPDLARLGRSGTPAAGTFEVNGQAVVAHPIAGAGPARGFLVVGAGRSLSAPDRDLIATACTLLSLRVRQRETLASAAASLGSAVVLLLLSGFGEAARLAADDAGLGPLPERVRWLCLRTGPELDAAAALALAPQLMWEGGRVPSAAGFPHRVDDEGLAWVPLPVAAFAESGAAAPVSGTAEDPGTGAPAAPPAPELPAWAGGAVGPAQPLGPPPPGLREAALDARHGSLAGPSEDRGGEAEAWVAALAGFERADLLGTARSYLRHRGRWEDVARELGVHRNTVRHRLGLVAQVLSVDIDDPDVGARLWLALRAHDGAGSAS